MSTGVGIFIALVGAAVFMLMQGLVVPAFGDHARARRQLKRRLAQLETEIGEQSTSSLLREKYLRSLSPLQRELESLPMMESLAQMIEQAGGTVLAHQLVIVAALLGAAGALAAGLVLSTAPAVLAGATICAALPFLKLRHGRNRRLAKLEEQLPDAVDMIRRALRAGHPFSAALKLVSEDLEQPIAKEFELAFGDINYGNDVRRALLGLLNRVPSVTMMAFVTAVLLARETGGNLAEILEQIARVVRGRFKFFRKVRTLSAEGRMSAWVLALVPLVLFAAISLTQPNYLPTLVHDPLGRKLIMGAVGLAFVGTLWIRKLLRIEV
jgi:tight adherence protein B